MTKDLNGNRSLRHGGRSSATPGGLGAFESAPPDSGQQKETKVPKRIVLRLKNVTFVLFVASCKNPWMSGARGVRNLTEGNEGNEEMKRKNSLSYFAWLRTSKPLFSSLPSVNKSLRDACCGRPGLTEFAPPF